MVRPRRLAWVMSLAWLMIVGCRAESREASDDPPAPTQAPVEPVAPGPPPEPRMLPAPGEPRLSVDEDTPAPRLPNRPGFATPEIPDRHDDGSYSVHGLREQAEALLDQELIVRAYVTDIYMPPPGCAGCRPASLQIADAPELRGRRNTLEVVGFVVEIPPDELAMWADEPMVVIVLGEQYRFRGKWVRPTTPAEQPRLDFIAYERVDTNGQWVYPPGASFHPKRG